MTVHNCPKCGGRGFTWFLDEEITPRTVWSCSMCDYSATEDESLERDCSKCGQVRFSSLLRDDAGEYRWCASCGRLS